MRRISSAASVLIALFAAASAQAELYRWIDPETGSVKFSTLPPPPGLHAEIVPFSTQTGPASTPAKPAAKPPAGTSGTDLESRWRELLATLMRADLRRAERATRDQLQLFQAMGAELDRVDPPGSARRHVEQAPLDARMREAGLP